MNSKCHYLILLMEHYSYRSTQRYRLLFTTINLPLQHNGYNGLLDILEVLNFDNQVQQISNVPSVYPNISFQNILHHS